MPSEANQAPENAEFRVSGSGFTLQGNTAGASSVSKTLVVSPLRAAIHPWCVHLLEKVRFVDHILDRVRVMLPSNRKGACCGRGHGRDPERDARVSSICSKRCILCVHLLETVRFEGT
jgi:hypothetical protein